ncbi:MAG TPA: hypothetical protein PKY28_09580, partial [Ferruginibacter sp.]|nr:hypothetical protein [Ferruginibacter sp.]
VLQLVPAEKAMKEVIVSSKKPLIERKLDRTIVNVDASITSTGSTALEVLENRRVLLLIRTVISALKEKPVLLCTWMVAPVI